MPKLILGSNSYDIIINKYLDIPVKYAIVDGVFMYHAKSFERNYSEVNKKKVLMFKDFVRYRDDCVTSMMEYFTEYAKLLGKVSSDVTSLDLLDDNQRWNIPSVIVYCYSQLENNRGYWVRGQVLQRYAQSINQRYAILVDTILDNVEESNMRLMRSRNVLLSNDNKKLKSNLESIYKDNYQYASTIKPDTKDYSNISMFYIEYFPETNEIFVGCKKMYDWGKYSKQQNEDGTPKHYFFARQKTTCGQYLKTIVAREIRLSHKDLWSSSVRERFVLSDTPSDMEKMCKTFSAILYEVKKRDMMYSIE